MEVARRILTEWDGLATPNCSSYCSYLNMAIELLCSGVHTAISTKIKFAFIWENNSRILPLFYPSFFNLK